MFEIMKSSRSIIVFIFAIGISNPFQRLKPKQQGRLPNIMTTKLIIILFFLDHPFRSIQNAMIFSNTAITVESAAKLRKIKNIVPKKEPIGMFEKTFGRVSKTKLGPLPGFTLNAKHAGKIINPATIATNTSRLPIVIASPNKLLSLLM